MKVDALAPNQGRVIFTFVDQANGTILHTDQVIGEIGSSKNIQIHLQKKDMFYRIICKIKLIFGFIIIIK